MWRSGVVILACVLAACTGSNEDEKDYQIVLGMENQPNFTGVLAGCASTVNTVGTTGGLLWIDSRKLDGSDTSERVQCSFIPTSSPPFDIERSFNSNATGSLFVSQPKPSQTQSTGRVQAFSSTLNEVWTYPSATVTLPATQTEFCPTQLVLSSSETPITNVPSESLLLVLDNPTNPQTGCAVVTREARVTALNRDGTRKGWLGLDIANRNLGQIQIAASSSELFIVYADTGAAYRVARLPLASLVDNTPSSSLQISEPLPGVFSDPNTNLALGFAASNTSIGLLVGVGGSSGTVLPVSLNSATNRPEFGAAVRETTETSDFIGATSAILWNRDGGQKPLTIFARERPDILLRRVLGGTAQRQTRALTTTNGVFTPDGFFWGLQSSTLYRLDVFNFPNLQLVQNPSPVGNAVITSINWIVGN
jgi:hypothetical protein